VTRPRLLILSFSDIAADARVLKQVKYFADHYDVTTYGYGPVPDPKVRHLQLPDTHDVRSWTRAELIARRFRKIYWNQPAVRQGLADLGTEPQFDVILANDIDAIGLAIALKPRIGVHADIHEYAPRQNEELWVWRMFIAPYIRWMCRAFLPQAASMTTVGQGIADEYTRVYGVHPGVVTNATPYMDLPVHPVGSPIRLVHSGASLRNRRLEVLTDAVMATSSDVTLDFYLMGNHPAYITELQERTAGSDRIRFQEPVPYRDLIARLNTYDIGIHVMAPSNFNNYWALPNKFFDYAQARLGLIVGPSPEMESLVNSHGLGAVTASFETEALTAVLDTLTPDLVSTWKANAATASHELSSERQVEVWAKAIDALVSRESQ
jgi:hypothetical protein